MPDTIIAVAWSGNDSPVSHTSFSDATVDGDTFTVAYPYWHPSFLKGREAQGRWADMKLRHLQSWGIEGDVVYVPKPARR